MKTTHDIEGDVLYIRNDDIADISYQESNYDIETVWHISNNNIVGATIMGVKILNSDLIKRRWFWSNPDWKDVPDDIIAEIRRYVRP